MNRTFQKSVLSVMALFGLLWCLIWGVGTLEAWVLKPLKDEYKKTLVGPLTYECLKSEAVQAEQAERKKFSESPRLQEIKNESRLINAGFGIVGFGVLYLFSCLIVRVVRAQQSNNQFNMDSGA